MKKVYIFVHGLSGWGVYDSRYKWFPYWKTDRSGDDLMKYLRENGYESYAASVAPSGSAWDRACELYAQLCGTRVDYGKAHSEKYKHERFGTDFTGRPLIPSADEDVQLVLLGHSFGGATILLFSELMLHGDAKEQQYTDPEDLSPLFRGGNGGRIHSIVTLAAPMNGTTAYEIFEDPDFDPYEVETSRWSRVMGRALSNGAEPKRDGRDLRDYADYDMHIDHAMELLEKIETSPSIYYFSVPCTFTVKQADGTWIPEKKMDSLLVQRSTQMGAYSGKTLKGFVIDESWRENDGLVNTVSARCPIGAPAKELDRECIERGKWNVFPAVRGDHMWPQGGIARRQDVKGFYLDLLSMVSKLK